MITEIWVDGQQLDLYSDTNIKHTLQVNDITEVKDRQASFTNSFSVPKTSNNVQIFGGLGIPSDTSRTPYLKPSCKLKIEGFDFIVKGWMNITETNDDYKIYVYSGIINFFKAIENKTLGNDLDLAEINHTKNLSSVILSFTNPNYKYLITDYNGLTHFGTNGDKINIDHLVPSVRIKYLWDKIHQKFGFSYNGDIFPTEAFTNLFLTYPKYIAVDTLVQITENNGSVYLANVNQPTNDPNLHYRQLITFGYQNNIYFVAPENGTYKLTFHIEVNKGFNTKNYYYSVNQEGVPFASRNYTYLTSTPPGGGISDVAVTVPLNAGDQVSFVLYDPLINGSFQINHVYTIKWELFDGADVSFSDELKDFSITDFVKEIFNRFALTPFSEEHSNIIDYLTLEERINGAETLDWSDKFIERTSETYIYESYAQQNIFLYQYNDKESTYNNGSLIIANQNIPEKKDVFTSKTYSPERDFVKFRINSSLEETLKVFKFYDKQVKEENGQTKVEYKGLEKRFHFVKEKTIIANAIIGSKVLQQEQSVTALPLADFKGLDWVSLLQKNYNVFGQILNDSRLHDIDLNLSLVDYLTIDLKKLYYFAQEQQYYILNKLSFDNSKSKGEFIRVKRYYDSSVIIDPTDPTDTVLQIVWGDNTNTDKQGYDNSIEVKTSLVTYPADDQLISFEWQEFDGTNWIGLGTGTSPYTATLTSGIQKFRMKAISEQNNIFYSNELQYEKLVIVCKRYRTSRFIGSGDDLWIDYVDCNGVPQYESQYGFGTGQWVEFNRCAIEGSVSTNGNLEDQGAC
jgi:hypothetical protein